MIAKEGMIFIFSGLVLTLGFLLSGVRFDSKVLFSVSVVFCLLTLFTIFFFRDPDRKISDEPNVIVSPADGKIVGIDTIGVHDFIGEETIKLSIFLNVFDVHVNRIPAAGIIDYKKYNPGKFFAAFEDKASDLNEQTEIGMTSTNGSKLIFKQIAGLIARRIVCNVDEGKQVAAGDRFGLIRFGSRTELFMPATSDIKVKLGEHINGGSTIVGYLKPKDRIGTENSENRGSNVEL